MTMRSEDDEMIELYSGPLSMFGAKAEIAVLEKGIECQRTFVPFSLATLYEPKHPVVARVNPKGQVPVLIDGDLEIFDSTQIFEYLEDIQPKPPLWPSDPRRRARARQLELLSDEVFFPNVVTLMPRASAAAGEDGVRAAHAAIDGFYSERDAGLGDAPYLAGAFSYADIAFFMAQFFASFLGRPIAPELTTLTEWRRRVAARESVRTVAGAMADYLRTNGVPVADLTA
jgi:glutathione S-transferase